MIITDTTEPATEAATEDDETRRIRERHVALLDGLQALTDFIADVGPAAGITDDYSRAELRTCLGNEDGSPAERVLRILEIARTLGVEMTSSNTTSGNVHYHATKGFGPAVEFDAFTIVDEEDAEKAAAALADAAAAERVTVDYRVDHANAGTAAAVRQALASFGVDAAQSDGFAVEPDVDAVVTAEADGVVVSCYNRDFVLPQLGRCVSVEAYAEAIALFMNGTVPAEIPCPARPAKAMRGIHHNGSIVSAYACGGCHDFDAAALRSDGYTVITLAAAVPLPAGPEIACGLRVEMAGTR